MKIERIRDKAKDLGILPGKKGKKDLILEIQETEGNFACFDTTTGYCDQFDCAWRADCLGEPEDS